MYQIVGMYFILMQEGEEGTSKSSEEHKSIEAAGGSR
jgi:hypothetical protein